MKGFKTTNEYAQQLENYDAIPKAVLAAIAVSALTCGGDYLDEATRRINNEWQVLFDAGIVPQKPKSLYVKNWGATDFCVAMTGGE